MHAKSARNVLFALSLVLGVAAPSAFAYDSDIGWVTNSYFKAAVKSGEGEYVNGDWSLNAPATNDAAFAVDSTQTVFTVAKDGTSSTRKIIQVDGAFDYADFYVLDDLTNDLTSAIAAISLVTNETTGAMNWMVLSNGTEWVALSPAVTAAALSTYTGTRVELDYTTANKPLVRYSVNDGTSWTALTEWFDTAAALPAVSNVCFAGKTTLSSINAKLSTTAAAEVNGQDYATVLEAIAAAKAKQNTIVLYKNVEIAPADLKGTTAGTNYTFEENGKTLTVSESAWKSSDKTGVEASYTKPTLTVSAEKALVAKIVDGESDTAYLKLGDAFVDADGKTVIVITNFADSATLDSAKVVALDLAGFAISPSDAAKPVIIANNANAKLFIFGGAITGTTDAAAISVANGAIVTIDELIATNNAKAFAVTAGSTVTISNGLFTGSFVSDDSAGSKINILGGYIVAQQAGDVSFTSGKVKATGGKFTEIAKGVGDTASITNVGYKFVSFAVPFVTNGVTFSYEIMTNATASATEDTKVFSVTDDAGNKSIGGVQIPTEWAKTATGSDDAATQQTELNKEVTYVGSQKIKKWECYVIGINDTTKMTEGPVVKGVQDSNANKIGFSILSPAAIKAKESGCDVKFSVQEFTSPDFSGTAGTESAKVDYTKTVELDVPSDNKVRYYKLKMHISPKQ